MLLEFDGTFIFALVSFIIFLLIMNLILYRPVMKVIDERQKFFDKNHDTVVSSKQKSEDVIKEKDDVINTAKKEAHALLSAISLRVKREKVEAVKIKNEQVREGLTEQGNILAKEQIAAKTELKDQIVNLVKSVTCKILDKDIQVEIDDTKLDEILKIER